MASADLSITKTASVSSATSGQQFTYTMVVKNNGPDTATGVYLIDPIPGNACLNAIATSPQAGSYTYSGNTIKWSIGSLNAGSSVTLNATVTAQAAGTLVNTSTVSGNEPDPEPINNSATITVSVTGPSIASADLSLWKESFPVVIPVDSEFTYRLFAINNGPSQATGVFVVDPLPSGVLVQSATSTQGFCTITGNTVNCQIGTLAPNQRVSIRITAKPLVIDTFENTASIYSDNLVPDPNPGNNTANAITQVIPSANLSVTKTASSETVILGEDLTYTIVVTNHGPADASLVVLKDSLSENATLISIDASQGTGCAPIGNNEYLCTLGNINVGAAATITMQVRPTAAGCIFNTASVTSDTASTDAYQNKFSICTEVKRPVADIKVEKSHLPEIIGICTPVIYTIQVTNKGPSAATGVTLTDNLPPSLKLLSVCSSQGHWCKRCHNELIFSLGTIAAGEQALVHLHVKPCQTGILKNTAIVTANEEDVYPENNQITDTLIVITMQEQIEYLIRQVLELVERGAISNQDSDCLLTNLENAKKAVTCDSIGNANYAIGYFIKTITYFIEQSILPEEEGCILIKIAEGIRCQLECVNPCKKQGDEHCDSSDHCNPL